MRSGAAETSAFRSVRSREKRRNDPLETEVRDTRDKVHLGFGQVLELVQDLGLEGERGLFRIDVLQAVRRDPAHARSEVEEPE
jgi:hypothetical protein